MQAVTSQNTISLGSYSRLASLPRFLGVRHPDADHAWLRSLSPRVMQWSDDIWIMDLMPCLSYWKRQATRRNVNPVSLIETVLRAGSQQAWTGVLAFHPWQAVFMLPDLTNRHQQSDELSEKPWLINLAGPFGSSFFRDSSMDSWFAATEALSRHYEAGKRRHFQASRFRSQISRMRLAMERLNLHTPALLQEATRVSVQRRFGTFPGEVWSWTFWQETLEQADPAHLFPIAESEPDSSPGGFPWCDWAPAERPALSRSLDDNLFTWEPCEALLQKDLDQLLLSSGDHLGIILLSWELSFLHMKTIRLLIRFRHPHRLRKEAGHHKTALNQASHKFDQSLKTLRERDDDLDFPPDIPVTGWTLTIEESIRDTSPLCLPLLGQDGDDDELQAMENQLPVPLEQYDLSLCFEVSEDFCPENEKTKTSPVQGLADGRHQWAVAAQRRPLFLYPRPEALDLQGQSVGKVFLERASVPWWKGCGADFFSMDFFLIRQQNGEAYWVARAANGQWIRYGLYS